RRGRRESPGRTRAKARRQLRAQKDPRTAPRRNPRRARRRGEGRRRRERSRRAVRTRAEQAREERPRQEREGREGQIEVARGSARLPRGTLHAVTSELQRIEAGTGTREVSLRATDARDEAFVVKHMAVDEAVVLARLYTQSRRGVAAQVGLLSATMGLGAGLVLGSTLAGLTIAALGVLAVGTILMLETSGRIVITESALVVQSG